MKKLLWFVIPLVVTAAVLIPVLARPKRENIETDIKTAMCRITEAGELENGLYINRDLGFNVSTPIIENAEYMIPEYRTDTELEKIVKAKKYVSHSVDIFNSKQSDLFVLEKFNRPVFTLNVQYVVNISNEISKLTTYGYGDLCYKNYSEEAANLTLNTDGTPHKAFSDPEMKTINGKEFYHYYIHDTVWDTYYSYYIIVKGDFGYKFEFRGSGERMDPEFVDQVMQSLKFNRAAVKYTILD